MFSRFHAYLLKSVNRTYFSIGKKYGVSRWFVVTILVCIAHLDETILDESVSSYYFLYWTKKLCLRERQMTFLWKIIERSKERFKWEWHYKSKAPPVLCDIKKEFTASSIIFPGLVTLSTCVITMPTNNQFLALNLSHINLLETLKPSIQVQLFFMVLDDIDWKLIVRYPC